MLSRPAPRSNIKEAGHLLMNFLRIPLYCALGLVFLLFSGTPAADGELPWPPHQKHEIEVRLIALAVEYPHSSFFSNDEVFIAEQELGKDESRFIKLVYDFLPYQAPLSDSGLNYSLVHTVNAVRDAACDESLWEMRLLMKKHHAAAEANSKWKYAAESPISDLDRRQARLRCYRTTSDDYEKRVNQPTSEIPY
jgi:hypothetical protein